MREPTFFRGDAAVANLEVIKPELHAAFEALESSNFPFWWESTYKRSLDGHIHRIRKDLASVDVISALSPYLRRSLDSDIGVYVSELTEPHGIRIAGQRFITSPNWDLITIQRNAVHEMIHPLLAESHPETSMIIDILREDSLIRSVAANADPVYGYANVKALLEEGAVQALEAYVNIELDQARDQKKYWSQQDGGMHLFAAAIFDLMLRLDFSKAKLDYLSWLHEMIQNGQLTGSSLVASARNILGDAHVAKWTTN